ncbi:VCBS repeat-containing protein [Streptomyces sp. SID11385]|uniref:FG-GAP repeat domain-containing protein n=1 Tax=Streptomyces sp. SID11385 TaxID=2706031 RepID=UPI001EF2E92A|nr:VCBS repeat-containing protein [Streptomyces sp. SID11385]
MFTASTTAASASEATPGDRAARVTGAARDAAPSRPFTTRAAAVPVPSFGLFGIRPNGELNYHPPRGDGVFGPRELLATDYTDVKTASNADDDGDGIADDTWLWTTDGRLSSSYGYVGGGWNKYDIVFSPGNLGGAAGYDILARDASGVLWIFLGYSDGTVTQAYRVGGGWDAYTQIIGKGDLTGDGKPDLVARDTSGALWLYVGTGDWHAPFEARTKIGNGWNAYDSLVGVGDNDYDGKADLIAREPAGDLYFYKGTGKATAPFETKRKIGTGYNIYRVMFS